MSFLFRSSKKTQQDRELAGSRELANAPGPPGAQPPARAQTEKPARATPTGSLSSLAEDDGAGSPKQPPYMPRRNTSVDHSAGGVQQPSADVAFRNPPAAQPPSTSPNASLYPWSQRRLTFTSSHPSPFPRYGAAANSVSSKEGDIYIMGGLINSSTVRGDLWLVEAGGNMSCYPLSTTSEAPGPRVGHSSLLVGNAFIVYGGDTKIDESDVLDETLYLLNTSSRQWSRVLPSGVRPSGRYGHSLNILGSKIYIFGGQVEGYFMNDLSAFDLNTLQVPNNRWEMLIQSPPGAPSQNIPAARTNHSMVTFNDKMYLFGGTNGYQWFNDVWCYNPAVNKWSQLDCIGYIPVPREGHAAALVDDVMYIFGGRTEEGNDLGDLAAFRITSKRWYTFQNMGPSPSPRSGHSMTSVHKSVVVLGGEPSTPGASTADLGLAYVLDTTKIRYPNDSQNRTQTRRPSGDGAGRQVAPEQKKLVGGPPGTGSAGSSPTLAGRSGPDLNGARGPRAAPTGPPPAAPAPSKPPAGASSIGRSRGPSIERDGIATSSPQMGSAASQSPVVRDAPTDESPVTNGGRGPLHQQPPRQGSRDQHPAPDVSRLEQEKPKQGQAQLQAQPLSHPKPQPQPQSQEQQLLPPAQPLSLAQSQPPLQPQQQQQQQQQPQPQSPRQQQQQLPQPQSPRQQQQLPQQQPPQQQLPQQQPPQQQQQPLHAKPQDSAESSGDQPRSAPTSRPSSPPPPTRQATLARRSSGRNSQTVALLKELDTARNRVAWYSSELELARKAGYTPNATLGPILDSRSVESLDDEDKSLIEALFAMRAELAKVQSAVDKQAFAAGKQINDAERQRDVAIQEAMYAKAKLAAHMGGSIASTSQLDDSDSVHGERSGDMNRKLASALGLQKDLQTQIETLRSDLEAERRARQLADDTSDSIQKRAVELESYKQQTSSELDRLKTELYTVQKTAREEAATCTEATAALELLKAEKAELKEKYEEELQNASDHNDTIVSLREAVASSAQSNGHLEQKLQEERAELAKSEARCAHLKTEHDRQTAELASATQRLRNAEELAERHANEAKAHRQAVIAGLDKLSARDAQKGAKGDSEIITALQNQLAASTALARKHQQETDVAEDKLRRAEERISGLEAYMESTSREGVTIRKQLQSTLKELQSLQAANSDLKNSLAAQQLETNAMTIQHNTLKDILSERGISPTNASKIRNLSSPRTVSSPEHQQRLRDLEHQLINTVEAHEETRRQLVKSETSYGEKLAQLDNDYQSAVHYVKGTERMLKQLQEQLGRYRIENDRLRSDVERLEAESKSASATDELHKEVEALEQKLTSTTSELGAELGKAQQDRDAAIQGSELAMQKLAASRRDLEQLQQENSLLEQRVHDAENKVSLLLDQVESSVDNYRRLSRQPPSVASDINGGPGHVRHESSETESMYGAAAPANARNSMALDSLADELETLRSHWETTNKNYRLSNAFDFETAKKDDEPGAAVGSPSTGLSESLSDWRKRLDDDEPGQAS